MIHAPPFKFGSNKIQIERKRNMKTIKIRKITGYKRWTTVEVIEGSEEHKQIIQSNKTMNYQDYHDRKEFKRQREAEENEVSADQLFDEEGFEFVDKDLTPEEYAVEQIKNNKLWEAVQSLPPHQRDIVILKFYRNLSLRDIGKIKGTHHSNISQSLQLALKNLRNMLDEKEFF